MKREKHTQQMQLIYEAMQNALQPKDIEYMFNELRNIGYDPTTTTRRTRRTGVEHHHHESI
jgi:hypothetical protein